uniref:Uncharacterized protein n=1 Tax=Trepomonas sp. PC1 TaxID=1076344 RepID=A0A146KKP8_9EUKA|eukprot:JAP95809.1 hypothetical protein TPC1_11063 [Trepomonas sp. PC1]
MQISVPPIILPPLIPPPSVSPSVNHLLDQTHYYLQKYELQNARRCLFEAYLKYQVNDALMDDKKAYFYTMNGYILMLMVELKQFNELTEMQSCPVDKTSDEQLSLHCSRHAVLNFCKAIEIIESRVTAERSTPRIFLAALFYFKQNYKMAAVFFKQAEAIALGTEGVQSILYNISSYNVVLTQMSQMLLYINQKNQPSKVSNLYNQPDLLKPLNFQLRNQRFLNTQFEVKQIELNLVETKNDFPTELFNLGGTLLVDQIHKQVIFEGHPIDQLFKYQPECEQKFKAEDVYGMKMQSAALSQRFKLLLGNHQYFQNCDQLEKQVQFLERELEQQIKQITKPNSLKDAAHLSKSKEVQALEHFRKRLGTVPQRALVQLDKKKKKGKK